MLDQSSVLKLCFLLFFISPALANTKFSDEPGSCMIIGDPDVYGIGIRLGYYMQWAAVLFATWIAPAQTKTARTASNIITVAVYANTFRGATHGGLIAAEWYIVFWMVFILPIGNWPSSTKLLRNSTSSMAIMLLLWAMILLAEPWLYFKGLETGLKEGCQVKVFLFTPINIYSKGWWTFQKVMSCFGVLSAAIFLSGAITLLAWGVFGSWNEPDMGDDDAVDAEPAIAGGLTFFQIGVGAFSIPFIELTIKANNITFPTANLTDSGQLIPFLVGLFTIMAVFGSGVKRLIRHVKND
ncbi:MAG: hypothetical protein M4579_005899 [Chaenotheca gracillima]|nr:MAG: hypothetical protein M4579_005899 [Chaenotheca gracillima]